MTVAEAFILSLVKQGLVSPFDLNRDAGLSLGTILPALRRLSANGLLKSSAPGPRRKVIYSLTPTGEQHLKEFIRHFPEGKAIADSDTALRAMFLAEWHGRQKLVPVIADRAADGLQAAARSSKTQATGEERNEIGGTNAADYRATRSLLEFARLRAEATQLRAIGRGGLRKKGTTAQTRRSAAP